MSQHSEEIPLEEAIISTVSFHPLSQTGFQSNAIQLPDVNDLNVIPLHNEFLRISQRMNFGPASFVQLQSLLKSQHKSQNICMQTPKNDNDGHEYLMQKFKNANGNVKDSQESFEIQRAERAEFVKCLLLSTLQDPKSLP